MFFRLCLSLATGKTTKKKERTFFFRSYPLYTNPARNFLIRGSVEGQGGGVAYLDFNIKPLRSSVSTHYFRAFSRATKSEFDHQELIKSQTSQLHAFELFGYTRLPVALSMVRALIVARL